MNIIFSISWYTIVKCRLFPTIHGKSICVYFVLESGCYHEQESRHLCSTASINNSRAEQFKMLLIGIVNLIHEEKFAEKSNTNTKYENLLVQKGQSFVPLKKLLVFFCNFLNH